MEVYGDDDEVSMPYDSITLYVLFVLSLCALDRFLESTDWTVAGEHGFGLEMLFVGCLTSQQHASVSQLRICSQIYVLPH